MSKQNLNYVRFDVGHFLFVTHRSTIEKYADSVLAKQIKPEFDTRQTSDDYIIIDRDGRYFGYLLNFMRDPASFHADEWTDNELSDLLTEADFYCLTDLVEVCNAELGRRKQREEEREKELKEKEKALIAPNPVSPSHRLEIIFGYRAMKQLLDNATKPTIVLSYTSMRRFHIDCWFAELLRLCDFNQFNVYCFAERGDFEVRDMGLRSFILSLYDPREGKFTRFVQAPEQERFKSKRAHYKCKVFKAWFCIQNGYVF